MNFLIAIRLLVVCVVLMSCAGLVRGAGLFEQNSRPENVFSSSSILPADVKRVIELPLACEESRGDLSDGRESLDSILQTELIKTKKFELVSLNARLLKSFTGRSSWTGAEVLPDDFFDSLQRVYGCDAVLFCQLTVFRAYAPLAVGWRMKLVDVHTQKIIWAVDEVFDAGDPAIARSA